MKLIFIVCFSHPNKPVCFGMIPMELRMEFKSTLIAGVTSCLSQYVLDNLISKKACMIWNDPQGVENEFKHTLITWVTSYFFGVCHNLCWTIIGDYSYLHIITGWWLGELDSLLSEPSNGGDDVGCV